MQKKFYEMTIKDYNDLLASAAPAPGGGSALCQVGATACSLAEMAINITVAKLGEEDENRVYLAGQGETAARIKRALYKLSDDDAAAFGRIVNARRLPQGSEEEKKARYYELQKAYHAAALVPLDVMGLCREAARLCTMRVLPLLGKYVASDCKIAVELLKTVARNSLLNVTANTCLIKDEALAASLNGQGKQILADIEGL